jgi:hypothetical protein
VHGRDGLGEMGLYPSRLNTSREDAVEQLLRVSRDSGAATDLLAIGPLTNLAAALRTDNKVLSRFRSVTIMGSMGPRKRPGAQVPPPLPPSTAAGWSRVTKVQSPGPESIMSTGERGRPGDV